MYGHALKMFQPFTIPHRRMPEGVSIPTEAFSAIYGDLPRQAGKGKGMHRKCFGHLPFPTEACQVSIPTEIVSKIYGDLLQQTGKSIGMHRKCFGNLPLPTNGCVEVYPYPPKSFRQFTLPFQCMSPKVWACAENVSVIYHCLPTDVRRCIHTHRNRVGNLP